MSSDPDLPRTWPVVRLGEVAEMCLGKMLDAKKNKGRLQPYLRNPNVRWFEVDLGDVRLMPFEEREDERYGLRAGDVVVCEGGEAGRAAVWDGRIPNMKFQKAIHRVRCGPRLSNRFLVHRLMADYFNGRLSDYYTGTTIKHLTGQDLARYRFPLPPLPEQQRIAAILDKADALRAMRRAAIAKLDTLTRSIFLDMFGDPKLNPRLWPRKRIVDIGTVVTGNTPPRSHPGFYGGALEWLKSDNLGGGTYFATRASETLSEAGRGVGRIAPAGSILVVCIAGSEQSIGKAAMLDREAAFNQQINSLQVHEGEPEFVYAQIRVAQSLIQAASTASMKGMVSKSRFEGVELIAPPVELQARFVSRSRRVEWTKANASAALAELDALFASLQHRAFRSEL